MSSLSTPPASTRPQGEKNPPSLKVDGISITHNRWYLPRSDVVQAIYSTCKMKQYAVIGSPPATGKTSLLQLLEKGLEDKESNVIRLYITDVGPEELMAKLARQGVVDDERLLRELKPTWVLLDGAQNAYAQKNIPFWQFVVKGISSYDLDNLFFVIAASYDLSTPNSPVDFGAMAHINNLNVSEAEARELFIKHAQVFGYEEWTSYLDTLIALSKFAGLEFYHIGIVMAGIRVLEKMSREVRVFNEPVALSALRGEPFTSQLNRCFKLPDNLVPKEYKDCLLDSVLSSNVLSTWGHHDPALAPFIRMGLLLTSNGSFSCLAARWYYNRECFPNRAATVPKRLDDLIKLAVSSLSAKRLKDSTLVNGFPKEATFQHLFNEALSLHLPSKHFIVPETEHVCLRFEW
jgi:hypothetical protein